MSEEYTLQEIENNAEHSAYLRDCICGYVNADGLWVPGVENEDLRDDLQEQYESLEEELRQSIR